MDWLSLFQCVLPLLAAALLIAAVGQGAVRVFRPDFWAEDGTAEPWNKQATLNAGLLMCAVCAAGVAFFALTALDACPDMPLEQALHSVFPTSIDADHYLQLAQYGYGADQINPEFANQHLMIVFFPLFPWLVRLVHALTGLGWYTAGVLVQPVLFGVGCGALYRLVQPRFGTDTANRTLVLLCLLPGSFFFAAPMTESLYLALTMLAFVCVEERRPALFAAVGFLAALTRSTGGLLAGAAGVVWLCRRVRRQPGGFWLTAALGPAAGTGVYLWLNLHYYGDPFAFAAVQKSHWSNGFGWLGETVRYLLGYLVSWWHSNRSFALYVALLTVVLILAKLLVLACSGRCLPVHWLAYSVAYILVTDGAAWLISGPRYALSLPFFPLGMALCCKKRWQTVALTLALGVVWLLYLRKYLNCGPIY